MQRGFDLRGLLSYNQSKERLTLDTTSYLKMGNAIKVAKDSKWSL